MNQEPTSSSLELQLENEALHAKNALLKSKIEALFQRLAEAEKRLSRNSRKSSVPPSSDLLANWEGSATIKHQAKPTESPPGEAT